MRVYRSIAVCVLLSFASPVTLAQNLIFVDDSASGPHDGMSWSNAWPTLQEGINDYVTGGVPSRLVLVAEGTYVPDAPGAVPEDFTFDLPAGIDIRGGFLGGSGSEDPDNPDGKFNKTILSGYLPGGGRVNNVVTCDDPSGGVVALRGFKIVGGQSPGDGGAVYCLNMSLEIDDVRFQDNEADGGGGALFFRSTITQAANMPYLNIRRSRFIDNRSRNFGGKGGGAMMLDGSPANAMMDIRLANVRFAGNQSDGQLSSDGGGGALFLDEVYNFSGQNLLFYDNRTPLGRGGAVAVTGDNGGEIEIHRWHNCTFSGNEASADEAGGAAMKVDYALSLQVPDHQYTIANTIMWGNDTPAGDVLDADLPSSGQQILILQYSNVESFSSNWGTNPQSIGNFTPAVNPIFVNAAGNNYRLRALQPGPISPCIDAGLDGAVGQDVADLDEDNQVTNQRLPFDLDLNPRLLGPPSAVPHQADMGAYESAGGLVGL